MTSPRITAKRRLVQCLLIVTALLLPFATIGGNPFLRMDIGLRTLFLAGVPVRIDQFYLVLLATLFMTLLFLLLTVVLGRVWCGWLCPQTVFNDLADLINERYRTVVTPALRRPAEHLTALIISAVATFCMLGWFMAPDRIVSGLLDAGDNPLLTSCFLLLTLFGYLNLLLVKRSFCRSYCPYGRFQAALTDQGTLNLAFLEETRDHCLRCGACVHCCPMGIDIRQGFQIECINCGRCIDACRDVMERRPGESGLIDYRFGTSKGARFRPGGKTIALTIATLVLGGGLLWGVTGRSQSSFVLQRIAGSEQRYLPDGTLAQPWRATIGNRSERSVIYTIRVAEELSGEVALMGPVQGIEVPPNGHREITFLIRLERSRAAARPVALQLYGGDRLQGTVTVTP